MPGRFTIPLIALLCGAAAQAQGPVLHEFVPDVEEDEALVLMAPGEAEPAAIVYDGELLSAPRDGSLRQDELPMTALPGDSRGGEESGRRSPSWKPDRITELEGTLGYYSVFTPTIAPFKRVTALDTVVFDEDGRTPVLVVGDQETRRVPVAGATAPAPDERERDRFWGSVVLDFSDGLPVPLPGVSPESRILTVRTEPRAAIRIEQDGADNFYAFSTTRAQVRLTFLTDAPRPYFNAPIPEVAADARADEATDLPPAVRREAETFARELGLSRGMALPEVLGKLTEHFRSFEESDDFPSGSGSIYLDLARSKKGVCRHRAYAFVITALALGVPARFVMNEAHAWVEVRLPDPVGWMRIDLGGAASGLEAHNAEDRPRYRPVNPDPLPRPEVYERSYSNARRQVNVTGLRPEEAQGSGGSGSGGSQGSGSGSASSGQSGNAQSSATPSAGERGVLFLTVSKRSYEVFRGRSVDVAGRVVGDSGQGIEGLRLEILLAGDREMLLGVTVSRARGDYRGSFGIPPDIPVGEYRLLVRTPGDERHGPALAP